MRSTQQARPRMPPRRALALLLDYRREKIDPTKHREAISPQAATSVNDGVEREIASSSGVIPAGISANSGVDR